MGFFGGGASVDLASPPAIGNTTPNTGRFTFLRTTGGQGATNGLSFTGSGGDSGKIAYVGYGAQVFFGENSTTNAQCMLGNTIRVRSDGQFSWSNNTSNADATSDLLLRRDAAGVLAQYNGTNAQTFRIYNTYTDASNYERGFFRWNTNVLEIGAEAAGTGTKRTTRITAQDKTGGYNPIIELGFYPDNILFRRLSFTNNGGSAVQWGIDGSFIGNFSLDGLMVGSAQIGWNSGVAQNAADLVLTRDAADTLAQRRSTNAQTFRLYNTFTSSTNFERLNLRWASNEFILDAEKGSVGGTLRGVKIGSATTSLLGFYGVTPVDQPATVADPAGGLTVDAEARTAINAIIDRLQELGLIA